MRRAWLVDEINRRGLRAGQRRIRERRLVAAGRPARQRLLDESLDGRRVHVADDGDQRASGTEVRLVERADVVARDRCDRVLGRRLAEGMRAAEHNAREHPRGDGARLRLRLIELHQTLRAEAFERVRRECWVEQHVGQDVERRGELARRRDEAHRAGFAGDRGLHRCAEQLQRVRQRLAVARFGSFAEHGRRERADAAAIGLLELIRAAEECDRERHERQIVLLGDAELRAVGERGFRPRRDAQHWRLARRRDLRAIERLLRGQRQRGDHERGEQQLLHWVTFLLSAGFDAWSRLPIGTTLSTTRPAVRYVLATRVTSAAVTACDRS